MAPRNRKSDGTGEARALAGTPDTADLRAIRTRLTRTVPGLGLLRLGAAEAAQLGGALTPGEVEMAQAALRLLRLRREKTRGQEPPRARQEREELERLGAVYPALAELRAALAGLARRSACCVLRLDEALTERSDRVLSYVDEHTARRTAPDPHQLDVRFAGANMIYESVLRRAQERRARTLRGARALGQELAREERHLGRLAAREQLLAAATSRRRAPVAPVAKTGRTRAKGDTP